MLCRMTKTCLYYPCMGLRAKRERMTVLVASILLLILGSYSIVYSRTAVRDDLRRQDITNLKRSLEAYNNLHTFYITPPDAQLGCTTSSSDSWFFGEESPLVKEQFIDAIPHDVRENKGFMYSYCVTGIQKRVTNSFYLEATLESNVPEGVYFDEDEKRKFDYRILYENGKTLYRVCGGEEKQCKPQL